MTIELLRHVIGKTSRNLSRVRDRALLLVGFAGGMRRSELAAIRVEHLVRHSQGITVYLPSSKTDQEQQGREVELVFGLQPNNTSPAKLTCPVRALEQWLRLALIQSGSVFRHISRGQSVCGGLSGNSIGWICREPCHVLVLIPESSRVMVPIHCGLDLPLWPTKTALLNWRSRDRPVTRMLP
jgi:hypothetical protein